MVSLSSKDEQPGREGTAEALVHPDRDEIELAAVLHALSDPIRLQVVTCLANGNEWTCGSLELPVSKSTCTHHFRVLREAGVIRQRVVGTTKLNSLRREDIEQRFPGLIGAVVEAGIAESGAGATAAGAGAGAGATPTPGRDAAQNPAGASR